MRSTSSQHSFVPNGKSLSATSRVRWLSSNFMPYRSARHVATVSLPAAGGP